MEEIVKFDLKGLWAKIFGSDSNKDDEKIAREVEEINKISSGISWENWQAGIGGSSNSKKKERRLPTEQVNTRPTSREVKTRGNKQQGLEK